MTAKPASFDELDYERVRNLMETEGMSFMEALDVELMRYLVKELATDEDSVTKQVCRELEAAIQHELRKQ